MNFSTKQIIYTDHALRSLVTREQFFINKVYVYISNPFRQPKLICRENDLEIKYNTEAVISTSKICNTRQDMHTILIVITFITM